MLECTRRSRKQIAVNDRFTYSSEFATHSVCDASHANNKIVEFVRTQRLFPIAFGQLGVVMDLDHHAVRAGSNSRQSHGWNILAQPYPVRRIDDHRQVRFTLEHRDGIQIERIARHGLKCPYSALAEQHVKISFAQNIFSAHQEIFDRCRHSPFEHDWEMGSSHLAKKREVLHVPCANLQTIGVLADQFQVFGIHHLSDDRHAGEFSRFRQKLESDLAKTLETVRRCSRLESATAQDLGAAFSNIGRDCSDLFFAFDRTRSGHDHHLFRSNGHVADLDMRMAAAELVGNEFVRLQHRRYGFNSGKSSQRFFADFIFGSDHADDDTVLATADFAFETPVTDSRDDVIDLLFSRVGTGDDNHCDGVG